jgi:hypothetical protein
MSKIGLLLYEAQRKTLKAPAPEGFKTDFQQSMPKQISAQLGYTESSMIFFN